LDFGIYRILNYKRDKLKKFIEEDLKNKVESAFAKHKDERLTNINQRFESVKEKIIQNFGEDALTPTGDLKEEFKNTPLGKEFLALKEQREEAERIDEIKLQVFNDLYNFFSRYYEEGDFVPQYRYSIKGHRYAIPYNGEEVKLYWANSDQYYIKTGWLFRDYTFKANNFKVIFKIKSGKDELLSDKKKELQKKFILTDIEYNNEQKELVIYFEYRILSDEEENKFAREIKKNGKNNNEEKAKSIKQEQLNILTFSKIKDWLSNNNHLLLYNQLVEKNKNDKPLLLYHINRFTARNTKDYFIHKNLKKFLSEQLDYFIKAEVLNIDTLEKERFLDKHITRAKVIREIGEEIIDFLSQIEDFQKRLWEKKKFVLRTEYVITTDRVPEDFYNEILKNENQKKEWEELGFEIPKTKEELKNKKLPIDTIHFSQKFKEELLEKLTEEADLDDLLDGLLIKSETGRH